MTLPKDTVVHIENKAIAMSEKFNGKETDYPTRTLPIDMQIHNLEKFQNYRNNYRAKMSTRSIDDFIGYHKLHEGKNCYVSPEDMVARTIFDIGTKGKPLHCVHKAVISLHKTALYEALLNAVLSHKSQRQMADWIEEWHDHIEALADSDKVGSQEKDVIPLAKAIAAIRRLTIEEAKKSTHEEGNFKASRTALETIEAKADEGMPGYFKFTCTPYPGLGEREFILRVNIIKSHNAPEFKLRILQADKIKEELTEEFRDILVKQLPEECETFIGNLEV